jgi:hypothetical protein
LQLDHGRRTSFARCPALLVELAEDQSMVVSKQVQRPRRPPQIQLERHAEWIAEEEYNLNLLLLAGSNIDVCTLAMAPPLDLFVD